MLQTIDDQNIMQNNSSDSKPHGGFLTKIAQSNIKSKKVAIIVGVMVVLILISLLLLYFKDKPESTNLLTDARDAYLKGDLDTSTKILTKANDQNPDDPIAAAALIRSIANNGSIDGKEKEAFEKAKPHIDEALKKFPENSQVLASIGYSYETAGDYDEALRYYEEALKRDPKDANTIFQKGHVFEFLGRAVEAFAEYDKAYELDKTNPFVTMAKAKVLLSQNASEQALELYKVTAELPGISITQKAEALTNASVMLRTNIFRTADAMQYAEKAIEVDPNYSPGVGNYGFLKGVYYQDFESGRKNLESAINLNPRISQNYWFLASLYRVNKKYSEAIQFQSMALDLADDDNTILSQEEKRKRKAAYAYDLASIHSLAGNTESILQPLSEAIGLDSSLKENAKKAVEDKALFVELKDNQEFVSLIQ